MLTVTLTDTTSIHRPTLHVYVQEVRIVRNMLVMSGLGGSYVPEPGETHGTEEQSIEGQRSALATQATMHDIHREVGQIQVGLPDWSADIA